MTETHEAARALVAAGKHLVDAGLSPGSSGNISARAGEDVLLTPTGSSLDRLDPDQLTVLRLDGTPLRGPRPSKEYPLHLAFYRRSPHTSAVVHVHSPYAAAASLLPAWHEHSALPPLTPYFVMRVGQAPLIPYAAPGDADQARLIERHRASFRAVLLQNHGPVTSGTTIDEAVDATIELEEASRLAILTAGQRINTLSGEQARALADQYGSPWEL